MTAESVVLAVAAALARERYRRNMGHPPPLTDDEVLSAVRYPAEAFEWLLDESRAAIAAYERAKAAPPEGGPTVTHTLDFQARTVRTDVKP